MKGRQMVRNGLIIGLVVLAGCGSSDIKPIDIFPEDNCALCRMAFSDHRFASEIITESRDVWKFDDLGCMFKYRAKNPALKVAAIYVMDYDSKAWIPYEKATIIETDVETPMGSGKVAFGDSSKAKEFVKTHPPSKGMSEAGHGCCSSAVD